MTQAPKTQKPKTAKATKPKTKAPAKPKATKAKTAPKTKTPAKRGRPSDFNQKTADEICQRLAKGETMVDIHKLTGMPGHNTVWQWRKDYPKFQEAYAHAREEQTRAWADQIISLADDSGEDFKETTNASGYEVTKFDREHVQRVTLRIDTRKWLMARVNRTDYGDNQKLDINATIEKKDDKELLHELEQVSTTLGISIDALMKSLTGSKE